MKKILLTFFAGVLLLGSCVEEHKCTVIDFDIAAQNVDTIRFSDVVRRAYYVKLTLPADSRHIGKILDVDQSSAYIFIISQGEGKVLQFDILGRYIREVGVQGWGKGEYMSPTSLSVDEDNKLLFVKTQLKTLIYNFSGKLLKEYLREGQPSVVRVFAPGRMVKLSGEKSGNINLSERGICAVFNYRDSMVSHLVNRDSSMIDTTGEKKYYLRSPMLHAYSQDSSMLVMANHCDTIFRITGDIICSEAVIHRRNPVDFNSRITSTDFRKPHPYDNYINGLIDAPSNMFVRYQHRDTMFIVRYNKNNGQVSRFNTGVSPNIYTNYYQGFVNDIDGGINAWPEFTLRNGWYACVLYPFDISEIKKSGQLIEGQSSEVRNVAATATDSQPILLFVQFK